MSPKPTACAVVWVLLFSPLVAGCGGGSGTSAPSPLAGGAGAGAGAGAGTGAGSGAATITPASGDQLLFFEASTPDTGVYCYDLTQAGHVALPNLKAPGESVFLCDVSLDGRYVLGWSLDQGRPLVYDRVGSTRADIAALATTTTTTGEGFRISGDGRLVLGYDGAGLAILDRSAGQPAPTPVPGASGIHVGCMSADGRRVAFSDLAGAQRVHVFDRARGAEIFTSAALNLRGWHEQLTADGRHLYFETTALTTEIVLYDLDGATPLTLPGLNVANTDLSFLSGMGRAISPDGRFVAAFETPGSKHKPRFYDAASAVLAPLAEPPLLSVEAQAWTTVSADGRYFAGRWLGTSLPGDLAVYDRAADRFVEVPVPGFGSSWGGNPILRP